ncbi:TIGR04282 family arsenosugar biosynthesis glycosyltransferase [Flagellimonas sp. HMM57]|uniref:TIGR04282 family arsenosugar biosynthesis glycosyltransferase n=1 Tax=unclassified Flagellimonas TaxID=2644544 RepID=UPI0013D209E7|nr:MULTISPECIES: TIGR04282 family arsenosugar biosynthesis glycosyltransferase [unclassified Flagellimonas]UII77980.1 TIGR04282 family arsenosugar biosynthesis glycosyltransferase [Flagellimonas sp. HMM57]
MENHLLLIFTRNPELGKCKTRLAATIGDEAALNSYKFLLDHTVTITKDLKVEKQVHYSEAIWKDDIWDNKLYHKKLQYGKDLGERMENAFKNGFDAGFEKIIIIGSDMYDLSQSDLEEAFEQLNKHDYVLGPAKDGGYYLLGMTSLKVELFQNKDWGTATVLPETMNNLEGEDIFMLPTKNDIDLYEDIKDIEAFSPYLKHIKE